VEVDSCFFKQYIRASANGCLCQLDLMDIRTCNPDVSSVTAFSAWHDQYVGIFARSVNELVLRVQPPA
jgi:hypothetical protein